MCVEGDVLRVMAPHIFLGALASVPTALLQKGNAVQSLVLGSHLDGSRSRSLLHTTALYGFSYQSLADRHAQVGQTVQVIVLWKICPRRPKLSFILLAKELGKSWFMGWIVRPAGMVLPAELIPLL